MELKLTGKVCLVTGATRGLGKGIALQLAKNGAKVYITGRTLKTPTESAMSGSLMETVDEILSVGGKCVAVRCDHTDDKDIERLFDQIKTENDGQLDILVNNAFSGINFVFSNESVPFWEQPITGWDEVNNVGLRNHYLCAVYAARLMVPRKSGLIVNISSAGGLVYSFGALYGIGKEACDRMAADCAFELKKHNVVFLSLWPGYSMTENAKNFVPVDRGGNAEKARLESGHIDGFVSGESPEFPGQCIVSLALDRNLAQKSGKCFFTADLGREYGLADKQGCTPMDSRQVKLLLNRMGFTFLAAFVPGFVRIPRFILPLLGSKF